jgi:hypothetical protein
MRQLMMRESGRGKVNMSVLVERRVSEEHWHVDAGKCQCAATHIQPPPATAHGS